MLKTKGTISGLLYSFGERIGAQLISFIVSIVLARILLPEQYGTVSLVTVFIAICNVFVNQGLGTALVQRKSVNKEDYSTVLIANIIFSFVIFCIIFFVAPFIAAFYSSEILTPVIRVMGLKIIISSVNSVEVAYVQKNMMFKKFFYATLIGTIASAFIGIFMAYQGFGAWALVAQYLTNSTIDTIMLAILIRKRPIIKFNVTSFKEMFSYGWKILAAGLIDEIYKQIRSLVIGKLYSTSDLAYYNKGQAFPGLLMNNVNSAINTVMFPVLSNAEIENTKAIMRKMLRTSTFILLPLLTGLACVSSALIQLLLTEKWLPCRVFLIIYCFTYAMYPIISMNKTLLKSIGRSDTYLKIEIIKKILFVVILFVFMRFGVEWVAISMFVSIFIETIINAYPTGKYIHYGWLEQLRDTFPFVINSTLMSVVVIMLGKLPIQPSIVFLIQVFTGVGVYIFVSKIANIEELDIVCLLAKTYFVKEK